MYVRGQRVCRKGQGGYGKGRAVYHRPGKCVIFREVCDKSKGGMWQKVDRFLAKAR